MMRWFRNLDEMFTCHSILVSVGGLQAVCRLLKTEISRLRVHNITQILQRPDHSGDSVHAEALTEAPNCLNTMQKEKNPSYYSYFIQKLSALVLVAIFGFTFQLIFFTHKAVFYHKNINLITTVWSNFSLACLNSSTFFHSKLFLPHKNKPKLGH